VHRKCCARRSKGEWSKIEPLVDERTALGLRVLLLVRNPEPNAITGKDDDAKLNAGYEAIGLIVLEDELRPHVGEVLEQFASAGVRIKIISGDDPDTVVALARQAGLTGDLPSISGPELDSLDDAQIGAVAQRTMVFGRSRHRRRNGWSTRCVRPATTWR
jgi:cation-transporting ATPase E